MKRAIGVSQVAACALGAVLLAGCKGGVSLGGGSAVTTALGIPQIIWGFKRLG